MTFSTAVALALCVIASMAQPVCAAVATGAETIAAQSVGREGMVPVTGDMLVDGEYEIDVDSSSSMFKIEECRVTVDASKITAKIRMSGQGYGKLFMGTAEEASAAEESACVAYEEDAEGSYWFTIPVKALNLKIECAAFSKKKELWYDRTLVFLADRLQKEAFSDVEAAKAYLETAQFEANDVDESSSDGAKKGLLEVAAAGKSTEIAEQTDATALIAEQTDTTAVIAEQTDTTALIAEQTDTAAVIGESADQAVTATDSGFMPRWILPILVAAVAAVSVLLFKKR